MRNKYKIQRTPERMPLVNPTEATCVARTSPNSSNQLAPSAMIGWHGRSGKYDCLQPQDDEEEEAFDNPTVHRMMKTKTLQCKKSENSYFHC